MVTIDGRSGRYAIVAARAAVLAVLAVLAVGASLAQPAPTDATAVAVVAYTVVGDAVPQPLSATPGDPVRGRAITVNRRVGLCLLCHSGPFPEERFQGNLAPSLAGAGGRSSAGQLRLRIADARRLNPDTMMPSYHRVSGLTQTGTTFKDKPILDAQQIEDVVAFLQTLRE